MQRSGRLPYRRTRGRVTLAASLTHAHASDRDRDTRLYPECDVGGRDGSPSAPFNKISWVGTYPLGHVSRRPGPDAFSGLVRIRDVAQDRRCSCAQERIGRISTIPDDYKKVLLGRGVAWRRQGGVLGDIVGIATWPKFFAPDMTVFRYVGRLQNRRSKRRTAGGRCVIDHPVATIQHTAKGIHAGCCGPIEPVAMPALRAAHFATRRRCHGDRPEQGIVGAAGNVVVTAIRNKVAVVGDGGLESNIHNAIAVDITGVVVSRVEKPMVPAHGQHH